MKGYYSGRVAVIASAQTRLRPAWDGLQHVDLISGAVEQALKGSGLGIRDVDFVIDSGSDVLDGRSISNCGFLGAMGAHHKEESRVEEDGLWAALYGVMKIAGGSADVGLIVAYSKPSESDLDAFYWTQVDPFYQRPVGFGQAAALGLQAQAYLKASGADDGVLADVAAHDWANARSNPSVELAGDDGAAGVAGLPAVPDAAEVAASPLVAAPLRELTVARPVDGAVALLLASERVARRMGGSPVFVTGVGAAMDEHTFAMRERGSLPAARAAAATAYAAAGREGPAGIDVAEVSAPSAAAELMVLDALGLAGSGKAWELYGGSSGPAVNPSGGTLPADPVMASGLMRLSDAALQLTEQVPYGPEGATSAVVHGSGGVAAQTHCVFNLEV